jgi:hypothetical protein
MADIFLSYAHQDRQRVAPLADALQRAVGCDVWWDRRILPGQQFDETIQQALENARSVVVVWSSTSVQSRWVRSEAREAVRRNVLVPIMIDRVNLPVEFTAFEAADLTQWQGEVDHPDFMELTDALTRMVGAAIETATAAAATVAPPRPIAPPAMSLPNLGFGTWTLRNANDGVVDWSNSVLKFTQQEPTPEGLALKGSFTWRSNGVLIGTETVSGYYVARTRTIFMEGDSVVDVPNDLNQRLAVGSYSVILSDDERRLVEGTWGSTATNEPGMPGSWEATR